MPNNGLNLRLVSLAAGLAAVIIIAVAALATHQAEEAALPVSQPEASDLITTPSKSNFGSIVTFQRLPHHLRMVLEPRFPC